MLLASHNLSLTKPSSYLLSRRRAHFSRMQKLFNLLLDLHLFCSHLFNISRNVYRRFTRPFNSCTNTWRQNNSTGGPYRFSSFNFRITLHYCATCFSLRLEQLPSAIHLLTTPLSIHQLTLALLELQSQSPALMNHRFVILPRRALWDHPEWKEPILQMPAFSLFQTHGRPLKLRRRTSHHEFTNSKNFLQME